MSEPTTAREFHQADSVAEWRAVGAWACTHYRIGSFATGAQLVQAISELAGLVVVLASAFGAGGEHLRRDRQARPSDGLRWTKPPGTGAYHRRAYS